MIAFLMLNARFMLPTELANAPHVSLKSKVRILEFPMIVAKVWINVLRSAIFCLLIMSLAACGPRANDTPSGSTNSPASSPEPTAEQSPTLTLSRSPSPTPGATTPNLTTHSPIPSDTPQASPSPSRVPPLQALPETLNLLELPGGTFTMGEGEDTYQGPPGSWDNPEHIVTLSAFSLGETEVTNGQYVEFLNAAEPQLWVYVEISSDSPPDTGNLLVYGGEAAPEVARNVGLVNLSGTRVLKDHDNADGDDDPFTGSVEPENPLNISYVGYNDDAPLGQRFFVKDPRNPEDFDWQELTNYHDYTSESREPQIDVTLNDYDAWPELADYPNNLPTHEAVSAWPATFIRWTGAHIFADFYQLTLPSEAQWEFAAQGGSGFLYATSTGEVAGDGSSAVWNWAHEEPATGHVLDAKVGQANPYGLYNMGGNVWEWVADYYAADFYEDSTDPTNNAETTKFVRRGGSWNYHLSTLKSAARASDEAFKGNDHFGFRVAGPGLQ